MHVNYKFVILVSNFFSRKYILYIMLKKNSFFHFYKKKLRNSPVIVTNKFKQRKTTKRFM